MKRYLNFFIFKVDTSSKHSIIPRLVIDRKIDRMFNNQLISSTTSKDRKLEQFYSIYNNHGESHSEQQQTLESNSAINLNSENSFPVNNKIQILKHRFNQLNSQNNGGNLVNKNSYNCPSTSIPNSSNTTILPYYQYQRPNINNKETIIEECKQSLDELLKASKWKVHSSIPVRFSDNDNNAEKFNSSDNQNTNSYKSSLQLRLKTNDEPGNSKHHLACIKM